MTETNKDISDKLPTSYIKNLNFLYGINDWETFFLDFGHQGILNKLNKRFVMDNGHYVKDASNKFLNSTVDYQQRTSLEENVSYFKSTKIRNTNFKTIYENYVLYVVGKAEELEAKYGKFLTRENKLLYKMFNETNYFVTNGELLMTIEEVSNKNKDISPAQVWSNTAKAVFDFNFEAFKAEIGYFPSPPIEIKHFDI